MTTPRNGNEGLSCCGSPDTPYESELPGVSITFHHNVENTNPSQIHMEVFPVPIAMSPDY